MGTSEWRNGGKARGEKEQWRVVNDYIRSSSIGSVLGADRPFKTSSSSKTFECINFYVRQAEAYFYFPLTATHSLFLAYFLVSLEGARNSWLITLVKDDGWRISIRSAHSFSPQKVIGMAWIDSPSRLLSIDALISPSRALISLRWMKLSFRTTNN